MGSQTVSLYGPHLYAISTTRIAHVINEISDVEVPLLATLCHVSVSSIKQLPHRNVEDTAGERIH